MTPLSLSPSSSSSSPLSSSSSSSPPSTKWSPCHDAPLLPTHLSHRLVGPIHCQPEVSGSSENQFQEPHNSSKCSQHFVVFVNYISLLPIQLPHCIAWLGHSFPTSGLKPRSCTLAGGLALMIWSDIQSTHTPKLALCQILPIEMLQLVVHRT